MPTPFIGVDPDSAHTAVCVIVGGQIAEVIGGGSRASGRPLCTVTGALVLLERYPGAVVAVERQTPRGLWSESCEGVALVHGIWVAACELARAPYTGVLPVQWIRPWLQLCEHTGQTRGSQKLYHSAAKARLPGVTANEDQAAALGIAAYLAQLRGKRLQLPPRV